jgi:hypothetical protein
MPSTNRLKERYFRRGADAGLVEETNELLVDWFVKHVKYSDKALGLFLKLKTQGERREHAPALTGSAHFFYVKKQVPISGRQGFTHERFYRKLDLHNQSSMSRQSSFNEERCIFLVMFEGVGS